MNTINVDFATQPIQGCIPLNPKVEGESQSVSKLPDNVQQWLKLDVQRAKLWAEISELRVQMKELFEDIQQNEDPVYVINPTTEWEKETYGGSGKLAVKQRRSYESITKSFMIDKTIEWLKLANPNTDIIQLTELAYHHNDYVWGNRSSSLYSFIDRSNTTKNAAKKRKRNGTLAKPKRVRPTSVPVTVEQLQSHGAVQDLFS